MLFAYKPVAHEMEAMHQFIEFIFREVWCKALQTQYGLDLFAPNPSLRAIMDEFFRMDSAGKLDVTGAAYFFYEHVNAIYNEFKTLTPVEIASYSALFDTNNDLESLCANSSSDAPVRYGELNCSKAVLNSKIESFFKRLYSSGFFALAIVKSNVCSTIGGYYSTFVARGNSNDLDACPFCGMLPIDGEFDPTRDAFDHYFPKSKYPFNSVNLRNLCPSCNKCNSGNKRDQDSIHDSGGNRRKAFYPFAASATEIQLEVSVKTNKLDEMTPECLGIEIKCDQYSAKVETWQTLFDIKKRYVAKCCSNNSGRDWLERILIERHNYGMTAHKMLHAEIGSTKNHHGYMRISSSERFWKDVSEVVFSISIMQIGFRPRCVEATPLETDKQLRNS